MFFFIGTLCDPLQPEHEFGFSVNVIVTLRTQPHDKPKAVGDLPSTSFEDVVQLYGTGAKADIALLFRLQNAFHLSPHSAAILAISSGVSVGIP